MLVGLVHLHVSEQQPTLSNVFNFWRGNDEN